jgi:hypothetical protein
MIKEEETFVYPNQLSLLLKFDSQLTGALSFLSISPPQLTGVLPSWESSLRERRCKALREIVGNAYIAER